MPDDTLHSALEATKQPKCTDPAALSRLSRLADAVAMSDSEDDVRLILLFLLMPLSPPSALSTPQYPLNSP